MTFTDDCLKSLKEQNQLRITDVDSMIILCDAIDALLARLEAAEKALRSYKADAEENIEYGEWRTAAGK